MYTILVQLMTLITTKMITVTLRCVNLCTLQYLKMKYVESTKKNVVGFFFCTSGMIYALYIVDTVVFITNQK